MQEKRVVVHSKSKNRIEPGRSDPRMDKTAKKVHVVESITMEVKPRRLRANAVGHGDELSFTASPLTHLLSVSALPTPRTLCSGQ
jgi:hypothetical protein